MDQFTLSDFKFYVAKKVMDILGVDLKLVSKAYSFAKPSPGFIEEMPTDNLIDDESFSYLLQKCALCAYIPNEPVSCGKCETMYCRNCSIMLAYLWNELVAAFPMDLTLLMYSNLDGLDGKSFHCLVCHDWFPSEISTHLNEQLVENYAKKIIHCNSYGCTFKADYVKVLDHCKSCKPVHGFKIQQNRYDNLFNSIQNLNKDIEYEPINWD